MAKFNIYANGILWFESNKGSVTEALSEMVGDIGIDNTFVEKLKEIDYDHLYEFLDDLSDFTYSCGPNENIYKITNRRYAIANIGVVALNDIVYDAEERTIHMTEYYHEEESDIYIPDFDDDRILDI